VKPILATALLLAALPLPAQQKVIPAQSSIKFVSKQMNVPVEGQFKRFDATVTFDPKKPEATKAQFEVDLASIDLGSVEGDTEVKKKPWLNVAAFPKATSLRPNDAICPAYPACRAGRWWLRAPLSSR